jgi:hypothetical protein
MCRNIKPLFNFDPPATADDVRNAAIQFVRKISGFTKPSQANQEAFDVAIDAITRDCEELLACLVTTAPPRSRALEAVKAHERSLIRFSRPRT